MRHILLWVGMLWIVGAGGDAGALQAHGRIEPLAGLHWQDTLVETIRKLNRLPTVTRVFVQERADHKVRVEGLENVQDILQKLALLGDNRIAPSRLVNNHAFDKTVVVVAEPIRLFHIDFMIYVSFVPLRDRLNVHHNASDAPLRNRRRQDGPPMRMTHVVFSKTKAAVFNQTALTLLRTYAVKTYQGYEHFQIQADEMSAKDAAGRVFFVRFKAAEQLRHVVQGYNGNCMLQFSNRYRRP